MVRLKLATWNINSIRQREKHVCRWLEKAHRANPQGVLLHAFLASAYALNNEAERAAPELAEARRLSLDDRYSSIARLRVVGPFGGPKIRALFEATYFIGLRKAGVPEE